MRISFAQGKGSLMHNRREYTEEQQEKHDNIDFSRTAENIILADCNLQEKYKELFQESVDEYNAKQKRADRKISDYLKKVKSSKKGEKPFYEDVVQIGAKEDFEKDPNLRNKAKEILLDYYNEWEERNPNLKIVGAYLHMDEASPHLHVDFIPVASEYKQGMKKRNSLIKALEQQDKNFVIPKNERRENNNATILWDKSERQALREICAKHNLEIEVEQKKTRKNRTVEQERQYHRDCEELQKREEVLQEKTKKAAELQQVEILKTSEMHLKENKLFEKTPVVTVKESELEEVNLALNHLRTENSNLRKQVKTLKKDLHNVQEDKEKFATSMMTYYKENELLKKDQLLSKEKISSAIEETYEQEEQRPFLVLARKLSESLKDFARQFDRYPQIMAANVLRNACATLSEFIGKSIERAQKKELEHTYEHEETHSRGMRM